MKTTLALVLFSLVAGICFAEATIPFNTVVPVRATEPISSKNISAGQEIVLVVAMDINVNGETLIRAGAPVVAFVSSAKGAQMAGISGNISLAMRSTVAIDGSVVPLSGQMIQASDSEVGSTVAVGAILCPLALVNKGKDGRISSGTEIRAMTIGAVTVDTDNPVEIQYLSTEYVVEKPKKKTENKFTEEDEDELF